MLSDLPFIFWGAVLSCVRRRLGFAFGAVVAVSVGAEW